MKTPINGARLSSSFGKRKHPILGYTKMHLGTDFAAPTGTPIMASGDGVVTRAQWCGGGGNCVKIKHNSVYQTVYAHMSKFGRGIKKGVRVKLRKQFEVNKIKIDVLRSELIAKLN